MTNPAIIIREATAQDMNCGFAETLSVLAPVGIDSVELASILWDRNSKSIVTYVAVLERNVVGTISCYIEKKFIHDGGKVCHIEDVAVREDRQRQGIGRLLMQCAEKLAADENCYKVILDCGDQNLEFYSKCGYRKHETMMRKDL